MSPVIVLMASENPGVEYGLRLAPDAVEPRLPCNDLNASDSIPTWGAVELLNRLLTVSLALSPKFGMPDAADVRFVNAPDWPDVTSVL